MSAALTPRPATQGVPGPSEGEGSVLMGLGEWLVTAGTAVGGDHCPKGHASARRRSGWEGAMGIIGVGVTERPGRGRFRTCPGPHRPQGAACLHNRTQILFRQ